MIIGNSQVTKVTFSNTTPQLLFSDISAWLGTVADPQGKLFNFYLTGISTPVHTPDFALWFCDVYYDKVAGVEQQQAEISMIIDGAVNLGTSVIIDSAAQEVTEVKKILDEPVIYDEEAFDGDDGK
jgi:hypothetical protein